MKPSVANKTALPVCLYCQTLENRSSFPPTGLAELDPVVGPVLLVHPPNSSSAATWGAAPNPPEALGTIGLLANEPEALKPPDAPGTIGVLAKELDEPHPPRSAAPPKPEDLGASGAFAGAGAGAAAAVFVSGVLQALEPHTSEPDQFAEPRVLVAAGVGLAAGGGDFDWFERLNTELEAGAGAAAGLLGAGAG